MSGVGEQLKRIRESQGLTQEEIGERLGFAGATIGRYENGHRQMRADELPRFAAALGVSPCAFFEERAPTAAARVYQAVMGVLRDEGIIPAPTPPPYDSLTDDDLRRIFESLPEDQQELLREIARRRRELRERIIRP